MFTLHDVEYRLPLAQAMALIHAGNVLDGHRMVWPDPALDHEAAFIEAVRQRYAKN